MAAKGRSHNEKDLIAMQLEYETGVIMLDSATSSMSSGSRFSFPTMPPIEENLSILVNKS